MLLAGVAGASPAHEPNTAPWLRSTASSKATAVGIAASGHGQSQFGRGVERLEAAYRQTRGRSLTGAWRKCGRTRRATTEVLVHGAADERGQPECAVRQDHGGG